MLDNKEYMEKFQSVQDFEKKQSPINIDKEKIVQSEQKLMLNYGREKVVYERTEFTHQFRTDNPKSKIIFAGKDYKLIEIHFHNPSEHLVDKQRYVMEMHCVHQSEDEEITVIAQLFTLGAPSIILNELFEPVKSKEVSFAQYFQTTNDFFRYSGSRTTVPCVEGVNWFVSSKIETLTQEQLNEIEEVYSNNCRDEQPLNSRKIYLIENKKS